MDLYSLKYFLALSKELHFWNTASKINITQSALSRNIQSLESELGVKLFDRNKRNVKLTAAGEFLRDEWTKELSHIESIHSLAKKIHLGEYGLVKIAHPDSISASILPEFLSRLSKRFPKLKIELIQLGYEHQEEYLNDFKIDFAFTRDLTTSALIHSRKLQSERLSLVVHSDHHFNFTEDITSESLENEKFILTTNDYQSSYNELILKVFSHYNISSESYIMCEFGSTIISLVKNKLGISILPNSYSQQENPGVKFIDLPFETELFINWRKDDPNPIVHNILELI